MKENRHIIEILERAPLADLSESEMHTIRAHVEDCADCLHAFEAAQISTLLIKERVAETIEPSPFFHTRVMAAIRERKASEVSAFRRLWNAAGSLVYSMAAVVIVLFAITFFSFGFQTDSDAVPESVAGNQYSTEDVLLTGEAANEQLTDEQVFSAIYEP